MRYRKNEIIESEAENDPSEDLSIVSGTGTGHDA